MRLFIVMSMVAMIVGCKQKQNDSGTSSFSQNAKKAETIKQSDNNQSAHSQMSKYRQLKVSYNQKMIAQSQISLYASQYSNSEPKECAYDYIMQYATFTIVELIGETDESKYYKIEKEGPCNIIKVNK